MVKTPPLLILAVGNPSRGDDALGPCLLERLAARQLEGAGDVELLTDFQLQVEHALDLQGRHAVLFVDAARPGVVDGACLASIQADARTPPNSHALSAPAVLQVAEQLNGQAPPAWQLAIEGTDFELGAALSPVAIRHLDQGESMAMDWIATQRRSLTKAQPH
ncbi:MAG TPA: hydrogenase maturation protease [Giesbergeria sp.]|nr:hydrogenase maturation protease [Giesbergeria sp.]HRA13488.1 hydrogenase maturation protease [Giesbergeria sp.]